MSSPVTIPALSLSMRDRRPLPARLQILGSQRGWFAWDRHSTGTRHGGTRSEGTVADVVTPGKLNDIPRHVRRADVVHMFD